MKKDNPKPAKPKPIVPPGYPSCCGVFNTAKRDVHGDCRTCGWPEAAHALVLT